MKTSLKDLKDSEIIEQLNECRMQIRENRFQFAVTQSLENPKLIRNLKKKIARLLTLQKEREIAKKADK